MYAYFPSELRENSIRNIGSPSKDQNILWFLEGYSKKRKLKGERLIE